MASANCAKALAYLKTKVTLENIGANDIVDGNPVLILGLTWTMILRFQIQDISFDELSAKDALLLWVKKKTKGTISTFSSSFLFLFFLSFFLLFLLDFTRILQAMPE